MTDTIDIPPAADIPLRNLRFREQAAIFGLVYRCEDCAHIEAGTRRCTLGYPNARLLHAENAVEDDGEFMFCKYFEAAE